MLVPHCDFCGRRIESDARKMVRTMSTGRVVLVSTMIEIDVEGEPPRRQDVCESCIIDALTTPQPKPVR